MFYFDYPRVKQSLGQAALRDAYPTLFLNRHAVICSVNPLALWMWGALEAGEQLHPERMLDIRAINMAAKQFQRIPVDLNKEFYTKISAMVKRLKVGKIVTYYAPFAVAMRADPAKAEIYYAAPDFPEREWEYKLIIAHPDQPETLMEFQASVYRLEQDGGFLAVYYPISTTVPIIEEVNSRLDEQYGKVVFTRDAGQDHSDAMLHVSGYHAYFRSYYPRLIQDPLWYLIEENNAHLLMMGMSTEGLHFFELFLTPLVRHFLGPIHDSTAPRALKYFDVFTAPYMREDHDLHEQYEQTIRRLTNLEDFSRVLETSRRMPININGMARRNLVTASDKPFYACRVILPWRYDPDIHLQFKSMVRFLFEEGLVPEADRRKYEVTLVPENYETDAALILLPLLSSPPDDVQTIQYRQFLWLLALLEVIKEALETAEEDTAWEPEGPFECIYRELQSRFEEPSQAHADQLIREIRISIELLGRKGKLNVTTLLSMLRAYTLMHAHLKPLYDFLEQELKVSQRMDSAY